MREYTKRTKTLLMAAVMSAMFLVALDQTIISTALGKIVSEFHSYSSLGWVVTAYLLANTLTVPLAGKFSDMFGRRPVLLIGVAIFTIGSLLSGMSQNIEMLIAWRALQGIGGGIITSGAFTIIGDLFAPRERGRWQGLIGAVFGIASLLGPLLGGFLTDAHGFLGLTTDWRWTFWINVPIGILAFMTIFRFCPSIKHEKRPVIDYAGAALLMVALSTLVLAVDNTKTVFASWIDSGMSVGAIQAILLTISVFATILFVAVEKKAKDPILSLRFFKNRTFTSAIIAMLFFGAAFMGAILYLTQFNQQVFGASATEAGLMLLPMIATMSIISALIGRLMSRTGKYKRFALIGYAVTFTGFLLLLTLTPEVPYWHEAIIIAIIGIGLGMSMPVLPLAVQNEFRQVELGVATASTQLFRGLGSTVGVAILSGVLTAGISVGMGDLSSNKYIHQISNSPQVMRLTEGKPIDENSALLINQQRQVIYDGFSRGIDDANMPAESKVAAKQQFKTDQQDFTTEITHSFTAALHQIFIVSSVLMVCAFISACFIRERTLRSHGDDDAFSKA